MQSNLKNRLYKMARRKSYNKSYGSKSKKKRSGAKFRYDRKDRPIITAWNASKRRGLISCLVFEYKNTSEYDAPKSGRTYKTMMAKVTFKDTGDEKLFPVSMDIHSHKVVIEPLGMVINPSKDYFGTFSRGN